MASPSEILASNGCIACLDGWSKTILALQRTADWLDAVGDESDVSPSAIADSGGCFACLTLGNLLAMKVLLLADIAVAQGELVGATPGELLAASGCWACVPDGTLRTVEVALTPNVLEETTEQSIGRAGGWASVSANQAIWMEVSMLAKILAAIDGGADVTPSGIMSRAGCFACLPLRTLDVISAYLRTIVQGYVIEILAVVITPDGDTVSETTDEAAFAASVTGTVNGEPGPVPQDVIWSVDGIDGGNSTVGTIDANGLYTAPGEIDRITSATIRARSAENESVFDEVTVTIPPFDLFTVASHDQGDSSVLRLGYNQTLIDSGTQDAIDIPFGDVGNSPLVCMLHGTDCVQDVSGRKYCTSTPDTGDNHLFRYFGASWVTGPFTFGYARRENGSGGGVGVNVFLDGGGSAIGVGRKIVEINSSRNMSFGIVAAVPDDSIDTWAPSGALFTELHPRYQTFRRFVQTKFISGSVLDPTKRFDCVRNYSSTLFPAQLADGYLSCYGGNRHSGNFNGNGMGGGLYLIPYVSDALDITKCRTRILDKQAKYDSNVRFSWIFRIPSSGSGLGVTDVKTGTGELFVWNQVTVRLKAALNFEILILGVVVATSSGAIPGSAGDLVQFDVEVQYGIPSGRVYAAASTINEAGNSGSATVDASFSGNIGSFLVSGTEDPVMFTAPGASNTVNSSGLYNDPAYFVKLVRVAKFHPTAGQPVLVFISPTATEVTITKTRNFSVKVAGTSNQSVVWSVIGGAQNGTIDGSGVYTAPATVPVPAEITVRATSVADPTSFADSDVTIKDQVELDDFADIELLFAADRLTGLTDGQAVETWDDAINSHDVTQANASLRPVYKTGIVSGKPVVRFTAASAHRLAGSDAGLPTGDLTIVAVLKMTSMALNTDRGVIGYGTNAIGQLATLGVGKAAGYGDTNNRYWLSQFGDSGPIGAIGGDCGDVFTVCVVNKTGTSWAFWINSKTKRTKTMTTGTTLGGTLTVGSFISGANQFDGDIAELAIYSRKLADAEVESILDGMADKYGFSLFGS